MGNASPAQHLLVTRNVSVEWSSTCHLQLRFCFSHTGTYTWTYLSPETPCSGGVLFPRLPVRPQSQHRNMQLRASV